MIGQITTDKIRIPNPLHITHSLVERAQEMLVLIEGSIPSSVIITLNFVPSADCPLIETVEVRIRSWY